MAEVPEETRIPIFAPRLSARAFAGNLRRFVTTGHARTLSELRAGGQGPTAMTFAPLAVREHRASYWVGPQGWRCGA